MDNKPSNLKEVYAREDKKKRAKQYAKDIGLCALLGMPYLMYAMQRDSTEMKNNKNKKDSINCPFYFS